MRISDWSSDVCSSDLPSYSRGTQFSKARRYSRQCCCALSSASFFTFREENLLRGVARGNRAIAHYGFEQHREANSPLRSEEHTSELQSLMRISYAVFCLIISKS